MSELSKLVDKAFLAIQRDINNIVAQSAKKLSPAAARDLVNYYKVLLEAQRRQKDADDDLAKLSDEELRKRIQALAAGASEGSGETSGDEEV